jgi:hypothetical protein
MGCGQAVPGSAFPRPFDRIYRSDVLSKAWERVLLRRSPDHGEGTVVALVRSYRDTVRLLLCFVANDKKTKITKLNLQDLSFERVLGFLRYLEGDRRDHVRTRS